MKYFPQKFRFKTKKEAVFAAKFTGGRKGEFSFDVELCGRSAKRSFPVKSDSAGKFLNIATRYGFIRCDIGDWVVNFGAGKTYPIKGDLFSTLFQRVKI
jgi:hypothetical protein